jgi:hypothetical protein
MSAEQVLSRSDRKRQLFALDPYFRDGWDDLVARWGTDRRAERLLWSNTAIVFRPDAVVCRAVPKGLRLLREAGFVPVGAALFRYDRLIIREAWRYQLNIATRDRIDVMDMIMGKTESLYVALRDVRPSQDYPASIRLSDYKGPSLPQRRRPDHLRAQLAPVQVSVLTYVHTPDEPADLVRDLGLFFETRRRADLLDAFAKGEDAAAELESLVARLHAAWPARSISIDHALERLGELIARATAEGGPRRELLAELDALRLGVATGVDARWRTLLGLVDAAEIPLDGWERTAIASALAARHKENGRPFLPDMGVGDWSPGGCQQR